MKKRFLRLFSLVLSIFLITLALCGCEGAFFRSTKTGDNQKNGADIKSLQKAVLKNLVTEYGMPMVRNGAYYGLIAFENTDLNDDGDEELLVICNGEEKGFYSAIYTFDEGVAEESWRTEYPFDTAAVRKQNGKTCMILSSGYRNWFAGLIAYSGGKFRSISAAEMTDAEEKRRSEAAKNGINVEDEVITDIYLNRINLNVRGDWEQIATLLTGGAYIGDEAVMEAHYRELAAECTDKLREFGIEKRESARDILEKIPYYGNRSLCKMDKEMAVAYANALLGMNKTDESGNKLYALLAEPAGDGMPVLITTYLDKTPGIFDEGCSEYFGSFGSLCFWEYRNSKAVRVDVQRPDYQNGFGTIGNNAYYRSIEFFHDVGHKRTANYYKIENATVTLSETIDIYDIFGDTDETEFSYGDLPEGASYRRTPSELDANGWEFVTENGDFGSWILIMHNGKNVTKKYLGKYHDEILDFNLTGEIAHISDGEYHIAVENESAELVSKYLIDYSKNCGRPDYSYDEVGSDLSGEEKEILEKLATDRIKGKAGEIFRISEDLYYVVVYDGDTPCGGVLLKKTANGEDWRILTYGTDIYSEEKLQELYRKDQSKSNINISASDIGDGKKAIEEALSDIDGTNPNDAVKKEIADLIEECVKSDSVIKIKASDNSVRIDGKDIASCEEKADKTKKKLADFIEENNIELNMEVETVVKIICKKTDVNKPVKLVLDETISENMGNVEKIYLEAEDGSFVIILDREDIETLLSGKGEFIILICKKTSDTYTIQFTDTDGNIIEKIASPISFMIPSHGEMYTVHAEYSGSSDNWGGNYDKASGLILFETPYSGTYSVVESTEEITDTATLDEETAHAIEFMVSKGYFALEDGKFYPDGTLTRYDFCRALVRMFFALDRTDKTSFKDVPEDDPYYNYVASGEKINVIEGYGDGTFRGGNDVIRQEVLAFCARTLKERKGYKEPNNPDEYLHFADADLISGWARPEIALAVRETLISDGGYARPKESIRRSEAALLLYRLYLLLYEVNPLQVEDGKSFPAIPVAAAGAGVAVMGAGAWLFIKRRKH